MFSILIDKSVVHRRGIHEYPAEARADSTVRCTYQIVDILLRLYLVPGARRRSRVPLIYCNISVLQQH